VIVTSLIGPGCAFVKSCKITIQYATLIISYYFRCVDVHTYEINGIKSLVAKTIKKILFHVRCVDGIKQVFTWKTRQS